MSEITYKDEAAVVASELDEFAELEKAMIEFMDDDLIQKYLEKVADVLANPFVAKEKAAAAVVGFEALANHFTARGLTYIYVVGAKANTRESKRKSVYQTLAKKCTDMSNALKKLMEL